MNTEEISELVENLFNDLSSCEEDDEIAPAELDPEGVLYKCRASSFQDCGLLTSNDGVVLRLGDGSEFQITMVRSR